MYDREPGDTDWMICDICFVIAYLVVLAGAAALAVLGLVAA